MWIIFVIWGDLFDRNIVDFDKLQRFPNKHGTVVKNKEKINKIMEILD